MTDVTDKMVDAAWFAFEGGDDMRAAIEAALVAREPVDAGELMRRLRDPDTIFTLEEEIIARDQAADAIEELVDVLTAIATSSDADGKLVDFYREIALATLTSMGIKL